MSNKPKAIAVEPQEGSDLVPFFAFPDWRRTRIAEVHAIYFDDGSSWDCFGGWRTQKVELPSRFLHLFAGWGDGFVPRELCG